MVRRLILFAVVAGVALLIVVGAAAYWLLSRDGLRAALEVQATSWLGHPVRIGAASARVFPRIAIQLSDIRVGDPVRLTLDDVRVAADVRPLLSKRIENADVVVSGSRIDMPLPFGLGRESEGGPRDAPAGASSSENVVRIVSIRSIALRSVRLRSRGREIVVSADSSLAGSRLALQRFTAESGGTTLAAQGTIDLSPRVDARLTATANRLDLDEILALADAFSPPAARSGTKPSRQPPRIAASISAERARAGALQATSFSTSLLSEGSAVALNAVRFEVFGGRYEGTVTARLGDQLSARLESRLADVDVAQLASFGGAPDTVTGRLSGAATLSGSGMDVAQMLRSVSGKGTATIIDGSIRRLHLVRTVILFFGRPAPDGEEGTDHFERLDAEFSAANRAIHAEAFSLHSADADITGAGSLNLDTEALDGRADLVLSEALSAQAGTDLYRFTHEGKRVVLPAAIGGTLSMPRLTIDVAAAAKRGLRNEIERRIDDLLKGISR